jgi:2-polyprenyl-3-methyl-5-hydroxy-6-metoxy-1,4-benzoquinol methylase
LGTLKYEQINVFTVQRDGLALPRSERLLAILNEIRGPEILHVGCVNHCLPRTPAEQVHHLHYQLCSRFADCHIVGLDIQENAIQELKNSGFDVVHGDAHEMQYQGAFDTVVAGELLEHLQNPGLFLRSCARALKPTGRLIVSTPNVFTPLLFLMYLKKYDHAFNPDHAMWFCPQTLQELLRRSGFLVTNLMFVDDLVEDVVPSYFYKAFAHFWRGIRPLLPLRLRNTMVAVCEPM